MKRPFIEGVTLTHQQIAVLLALVVLVLGALRTSPGVAGFYHDDAVYISTAKALAEGRGYHLINLPTAPAQTKYPIFYPAVLAILWKVWPTFPANVVVFQRFSLLCAAAAVALGYLYVTRFRLGTKTQSAVASLMCATSPAFVYFATQSLSEAFFTLLLMIALSILEIRLARNDTPGVLTGVVVALPFLCRTIGIVFIPVAAWLVVRNGRPVRRLLLGAAIVVLPWIVWIAANRPTAADAVVLGYYTSSNYAESWFDSFGGRLLAINLLDLLISTARLPVEGLTVLGVFDQWPVGTAVGALIWVRVLRGFTQARVAVGFFTASAVVMLFWPWPPERFLVPLLPVSTVFLVVAITSLSQNISSRLRPAILGVAACVVICANLYENLELARLAAQDGISCEGRSSCRVLVKLRKHVRLDQGQHRSRLDHRVGS